MASKIDRSILGRALWELTERQHGVVSREQLLSLGLSPAAIEHRLRRGRLHRVARGIYAVGRPELSREGRWMVALLAGGPHAVLSHLSAAAVWGIADEPRGGIAISVPTGRCRRRGITSHCRPLSASDLTVRRGLRLTTPARTILDIAPMLLSARLERAIGEADRLDLIDPEALRLALDDYAQLQGVAILGGLLDRRTFVLTRSELERLFVPIALRAGLSRPEAGRIVNGFEVDFFWPELGLVVETDGLRYHRTPAQQARDRRRDQVHSAAGLTPLRFTHEQIAYDPDGVCRILRPVAARLRTRR